MAAGGCTDMPRPSGDPQQYALKTARKTTVIKSLMQQNPGAFRQQLEQHGALLADIAAQSILHGLQSHRPIAIRTERCPPLLRADGASFVTLKHANGRLRGCIGSYQAHKPLAIDLAENACKAAFKDPRFAPCTADALAGLDLSLSLLSPLQLMNVQNESGILAALQPGRHGLAIQAGGKRAIFLPIVWRELPEPRMFLDHLKAKAGLPTNRMIVPLRAWLFTTQLVNAPKAFARRLKAQAA